MSLSLSVYLAMKIKLESFLPTRMNAGTRQASVTLAAQMPGDSQSQHYTCLIQRFKY